MVTKTNGWNDYSDEKVGHSRTGGVRCPVGRSVTRGVASGLELEHWWSFRTRVRSRAFVSQTTIIVAMAAQLQQPDFINLGNLLTNVAHEISRVPNMPVVVGLDRLMGQLREQHREDLAARERQHREDLAARDRQHQELIRRLDVIQEGYATATAHPAQSTLTGSSQAITFALEATEFHPVRGFPSTISAARRHW